APDEKFHREVVNALCILLLVSRLGLDPPLRQNVAHGTGEGLEPLARAGDYRIDGPIEDQMSFIQRVFGANKRKLVRPVLFENVGTMVRRHRDDARAGWTRNSVRAHLVPLERASETAAHNIERLDTRGYCH